MRSFQLSAFFIFLSSLSLLVAEVPTEKIPRASAVSPKQHSLEAAEKMLTAEPDLERRSQILLRWLKLKDETLGAAATQEDKKAIVEKLISEIEKYEKASPIFDLDTIYRQVAYRILELENSNQAYFYFNKMKRRTANDDLAFGDSLMANQMANLAFDAYQRAEVNEELKPLATYKKAWAHVQLHQFKEALTLFDETLHVPGEKYQKLRESAYRDRLLPYAENFSKVVFDEEEATHLKEIAAATSGAPFTSEITESLFQIGLMEVVKRFSEKGEIARAESAYRLITQKDKSSLAFLDAAPLWLKTYRAALNHKGFEEVIRKLPSGELDSVRHSKLASELVQSAHFYNTLFTEAKESVAKPLLLLSYIKLFELFPKQEADESRVGYADILLQAKNDEKCLAILIPRAGTGAALEDQAQKLEAQCRLRNLSHLYKETKNAAFPERLRAALVEKKIYSRLDLGIPSEKIFDGLSRMLIGGLKRDRTSDILLSTLTDLLANYPYSKDSTLFKELSAIASELKFNQLTAQIEAAKNSETAEISLEKIASQFFELYQSADKKSALAEKALQNSISLVKSSEISLNYCDEYQKSYSPKFKPGQKTFNRCQSEAENSIQLHKERLYWLSAEKYLTPDQKVKLGLLELALNDEKGRARILSSKSKKAEAVLANWNGQDDSDGSAPFLDLQKQSEVFARKLTPVSFKSISTVVPARVKDFEILDQSLVKYFHSSVNTRSSLGSRYLAGTYALRVRIAAAMSQWISQLPEPPLAAAPLRQYRISAAKIISTWKERLNERNLECSQNAYLVSFSFSSTDPNFCQEATLKSAETEYLRKWEKTRSGRGVTSEDQKDIRAQKYLKAAEASSAPLITRYLLTKALDLATSSATQAKVQLGFAKLTDNEKYWLSAAALDGDLPEPIEYLRAHSERNPFFQRVSALQLELIRDRKAFDENTLRDLKTEPVTLVPNSSEN
jgi:hypothetical protein